MIYENKNGIILPIEKMYENLKVGGGVIEIQNEYAYKSVGIIKRVYSSIPRKIYLIKDGLFTEYYDYSGWGFCVWGGSQSISYQQDVIDGNYHTVRTYASYNGFGFYCSAAIKKIDIYKYVRQHGNFKWHFIMRSDRYNGYELWSSDPYGCYGRWNGIYSTSYAEIVFETLDPFNFGQWYGTRNGSNGYVWIKDMWIEPINN